MATPLTAQSAPAPANQPAVLSFRAMLREPHRSLVLHTGEPIKLEVEVKNEGSGPAQAVEVAVHGSSTLIEQLPTGLAVGDLAPGEMKRVVMEAKMGPVKEPIRGELLLSLRTVSETAQLPDGKRFLIALKPQRDPKSVVKPIDVDKLPKLGGKYKQPKAVGIAIGVGRFRDNDTAKVRFAARDAQTVSAYLQTVAGVPAGRVRTLTDTHALRNDVAEVLEEWLPKQVEPTTVVYVYLAGRGLVDRATGAVSLVPFDGTVTSAGRAYPLRRLHELLTRLPIQWAIVMLELSLESPSGSNLPDRPTPVWELEGAAKNKIMWMVGNRTLQDAHAYDSGHHGLFTYHLLKGLGGPADINRDGIILAGELCAYARGQVSKVAREQFANEQDPLCIPKPGQGITARLQPLARLR